jgi:hypothetical protein
MWRCPHCGTPQQEAARCWVCRRSSTTCSTCRHFRASLAATVGYCGLDPRRAPLTGREHRGCWAERVVPAPVAAAPESGPSPNRLRLADTNRPRMVEGFVPVEVAGRSARPAEPGPDTPGVPPRPLPPAVPPPGVIQAAESAEAWAARDSLFGDAEL